MTERSLQQLTTTPPPPPRLAAEISWGGGQSRTEHVSSRPPYLSTDLVHLIHLYQLKCMVENRTGRNPGPFYHT